jgi:hypothetical protein
MAGALDTLLKNVAKSVVADLGSALDSKITYRYRTDRTYNVSTSALSFTTTTYADIVVPIEYVSSDDEQNGSVDREAKIYITPDLIGGNQPSMRDEIDLTFGGEVVTAQIINIQTMQGGQTYLFVLRVKF